MLWLIQKRWRLKLWKTARTSIFPQGAGIQAGKTIVDNKVEVLITGHCGPKAFKVLRSAGIEVMTGAGGTVTDAIAQFNNGELEISAEADVESHWA